MAIAKEHEGPPPTADQVLRYASDTLYAVRPQPAPILIQQVLQELQAALASNPQIEEPPKDLADAVARINAKLGKMEHPPKPMPDIAKIVEPPKAAAEHHAAAK